MARALLIVNPAAARTRSAAVRGVEEVFRREGWQIDSHATGGPGDARTMAAEGIASGAEMVVVFGGDGTTMQAAAAMVGTEVPLAVIPGGTGNQLAGNLRVPPGARRAAVALLAGTARPLDLGRVERNDGSHYFAVACGTGVDARVMAETLPQQKRKWGTMAYLATTIRLLPDLQALPFLLTIDGVEYDAAAAVVLVANCGELTTPVALKLGAGISPEDGVLDVIVLHAESAGGGLRAMWDLLRDAQGTYGKDVFAAHARGTAITVTCDAGEPPMQIDGELAGVTPFSAIVVPGAIRVVHPQG